MNPNVYQGVFGGANCRDSLSQPLRSCDCEQGECKAGDQYVEQLRETIRYSVPKGRLAAFFAEPIQVSGCGFASWWAKVWWLLHCHGLRKSTVLR